MPNHITVASIKSFIASNDFAFMATQSKLCAPIIIRMCNKMSHGIGFDDIKVFENLIIDGHHRYLSALIMGYNIGQVNSHKTSATKVFDWKMVALDEEDWDTAARIAYVNELDAIHNNLDIDFLKQITSSKN